MSLSLVAPKPKRGRPNGSLKSDTARLRDEIRTVATMNELLVRAPVALNPGHFARWFDQAMQVRHPRLIFNTEFSNKWRRNFQGRAALLTESLAHLQELFPDSGVYLADDCQTHELHGARHLPTVSHQTPDGTVWQENLSASDFYQTGPGRLWDAVWAHDDSVDLLWGVYPNRECDSNLWGAAANFGLVVQDLQIELYSKFDFSEAINCEHLGRAIVLYRLNRAGRGTAEDGIDLYLCMRLALAETRIWLDRLGVKEQLSAYLIGLELDRQLNDDFYADLLARRHQRVSEFDRRAYAENPFLFQRSDVPHVARRNEMLARLAM